MEAVLDYRTAATGLEVINHKDKKQGMETLQKNPRLGEMLVWMSRAQRGVPLEGGNVEQEQAQLAAAYRVEEDEEIDGDAS